MSKTEIEPHIFIIFGATSDLMRRKLAPSLLSLAASGLLKEKCLILGVARTPDLDDISFRSQICEIFTGSALKDKLDIEWCNSCVYYQSIGSGNTEDYKRLAARIADLEKEHALPGNRIFYLALPPDAFPPIIKGLGKAGLNTSHGWTRVVIEKPFGRDLTSAQELNQLVHKYFDESQIYRIDHYLGKETVQNLLAFRFSNTIFESLWNRDRVEQVEITVAEELGIGKRASYYEQTGALRDMVQNHITQLLTLIAMEAPPAFDSDAIRGEKIKVLRSLAPIRREDVVFGQYTKGQINGSEVRGYKDEASVSPLSTTETYAAVRVEIANWRWQGVPFYLRTGKCLAKKTSAIVVTFRYPPISIFQSFQSCNICPNRLVITLQPDEGFDLYFEAKSPGEPFTIKTHNLHFRYNEVYGRLPDAYETLLLDIMEGDQTLFIHADETESAWRHYTPLLEKRPMVYPYAAGTWGPAEANHLFKGSVKIWTTL
jgi:glucose-6-phosphate 1-dehydrogenase